MQELFDEFLSYQPRQDLAGFSQVPTEKWQQLGQQRALQLFQQAAQRVPAYKDYLSKHRVDPSKVQTVEDLKVVPLTSKVDYINQYPLKDLILDGDLSKITTFHYSSGSTAKPTHWPKSATQDFAAYKGVELLLTYYFDIDKQSTLVINAFAMGAYPSGETIHTAIKMLAEKGLPIKIVSPGTNIDQTLTIFNDLASSYDQVIIGGYASLLKDIIDTGEKRGINWQSQRVRLLTGGEKPSENWQEYVVSTLHLRQPNHDILAVYASSEAGVAGFSTPFTDMLRSYLHQHYHQRHQLFKRVDLPSVVQYIPPAKFMEIIDNEVIVTSNEYTPLIRYQTKDQGQILSPKQIIDSLGQELANEYEQLQEPYGLLQLPVLAIDGRIDRTIMMYGANIYPEQISNILDDEAIRLKVTGRFVIEKTENDQAEPHVKIVVELAPGVTITPQLQEQVGSLLQLELMELNEEYHYIVENVGAKALLEVSLKTYQSAEVYIKSGKGIGMKNSAKR